MGLTSAIAAMAIGSVAAAGSSIMSSMAQQNAAKKAESKQSAAIAADKAARAAAAKNAEGIGANRNAKRSTLLATSSQGLLGNPSVTKSKLLGN